jgi:hypothetical protein
LNFSGNSVDFTGFFNKGFSSSCDIFGGLFFEFGGFFDLFGKGIHFFVGSFKSFFFSI